MGHYKKLLRWISSQEHLFFIFALLFVVPNFVLFFTEPLPVVVGIASIILPLAFWMGLLLLARKPGIVVWCLLPKVILDGGQLVLLYMFGQSVIAVDMFLNLTSSDVSEASELLGNLILIIGCVFFCYTLPTLYLAFRSIRLKEKLSSAFRRKWARISLGTFITGIILCLLSPLQDYRFSVKDDIFPVNALYNLYFAINKAEKNANYMQTSADFTFNATKPDRAKGRREIYLLVVGETSRAMEWSLYGYDRETTPCMEKLDGLVHFTDVVTQSNNTHKSVPIILSAASAEDYSVLYNEKSIVTAFKEAGFRTVVIANQKLTTSMIGAFYREADTFIDMSKFKTGSYLTSLYDGAILPYLQEELNKSDDNLFIVLHTYGSHFNYHERYPKEFSVYKPDKVEGIRASHKKVLRNAYDNSIRYTDYVLGEIVNMLSETKACASMIYLSDHGEDIFDDSRNRYLHASPIPTYYQLHIPLLVWFSSEYQEEYPEKYRITRNHQTVPVSTNSVFHTMLDIANVYTPVADSTLALSNPAFTVRDRMYLGDHDDPIPFWEVGLKKFDFEMMDKWRIAYGKD
ncbi:phosphoethanolamine transferase [Parabacteroides bouchesdurhonensis]|uniref:phosphoethanolamine transferase n=1 Tax=Parabacteroides bouchesdurhonensis TaxID=1936995 RepID=UPI000C85F213|nr:phosphoethanolamine transferase [Parabacteroides bouchesdurhonensis]